MSAEHLTGDIAAKLIDIAPDELDRLSRAGAIRRVSRNEYRLVDLVRGYIAHLQAEFDRQNRKPSQSELAQHLDLSERSVRYVLADLGLDHKASTRDEIRTAYIRRLREQAAGRATTGDLSLTDERAGLAREQKLLARIRKEKELGEWAPIENLTLVLSRVTSQMASVFESLPIAMKRQCPELSAEQLTLVREELARARNLLVSVGREAVRAAAEQSVDYVEDYVDATAETE